MKKSLLIFSLSIFVAIWPNLSVPPPVYADAPITATSNLTRSDQQLLANPSDGVLVDFDSKSAQTAFMQSNKLSTHDLVYQPPLKRYQVKVSSSMLSVPSGTHMAPVRKYHTLATVNDPLRSAQYALDTMKLPNAWNTTQGNAQTVIAVIDTGFALSHQDMTTKYTINVGESGPTQNEGPAPNCTSRGLALDKSCNNLDNDGNGYVNDVKGWNFYASTNNVAAGQDNPSGAAVNHGTLTSSLAAAATNNSLGIAGACPLCTVLPIKALDDTGSGSTTDIATAIYYAVSRGASVINLSLGGTEDDPVLKSAITYAIAHNVVVVASAGNSSAPILDYPAAYDGVVAVVASDSSNQLASFSNEGPGAIAAPGVGTYSADWSSTNQISHYAAPSGTSMSAAIVSGVVGLLRSKQPTATPAQIKYALGSSATTVVKSQSYPLVDVPQALLTLAQQVSLVTIPVYRFWSPAFGNDHFYTADVQERDTLKLDTKWRYEGVAFQVTACSTSNQTGAVYRFWSPTFNNSHFFTTDPAERDKVAGDPNWRYEGIAYCSMPDSRAPNMAVYRFWSPNFANVHFYTSSVSEANTVKADPNWIFEGIGYNAR